MAQLKDTIINGALNISGETVLTTPGNPIRVIHPDGTKQDALEMSNAGNLAIGYGGYINKNGNTNIYGKSVRIFASEASANYKPYYSVGDGFGLNGIYTTAGYITTSATEMNFIIPLDKPVIGNPVVTLDLAAGFIIRQWNSYIYGSGGSTWVKPTKVTAELVGNFIQVKATWSSSAASGATNNTPVGIVCSGSIVFS